MDDYETSQPLTLRCRRRKGHGRGLPVHRRAGLASASLSTIATVVLMGMDEGRRAGGLDQCPHRMPLCYSEIPQPHLRRRVERCRAACRTYLDAMPLRRRAPLVCVFCRFKWSVLRPSRHQALRSRAAVCLPSLLSAGLFQPTGIGPSARLVEVPENPDAAGRRPEHVG